MDESGLLMGPLHRRTRSAKGQTPALTQGGSHRQEVSVAAAVWLSPRRDHLGLYSQTLADGYFDNRYVTAFIEAMLRDLSGRFVVVWDGGPMHKGEPIRAPEARFADRLTLEQLPPWAPMLNPVEPPWSWSKWERLSNFAARDVQELDERVVGELAPKRDDQGFLKNLFHASELPLPRTLLSCLSVAATAPATRTPCRFTISINGHGYSFMISSAPLLGIAIAADDEKLDAARIGEAAPSKATTTPDGVVGIAWSKSGAESSDPPQTGSSWTCLAALRNTSVRGCSILSRARSSSEREADSSPPPP